MDDTAYFEGYLDHILSPEEMTRFETKLRTEPAFAAAFEIHLASYNLVKANGALQMKSILRNYEKKKYGHNRIRLLKIISAAAAVVGMMAIVYFLLPTRKPGTNEELFVVYFSPYRDPVTTRGDAASNDIRQLANQAYSSKDFTTAFKYYSQLSDLSPADKFYFGLSALQGANTELAISMLTEVSHGESDFKQQATWYLSLTYIRAGQKDQAKTILNEIVRDKGYMHESARDFAG